LLHNEINNRGSYFIAHASNTFLNGTRFAYRLRAEFNRMFENEEHEEHTRRTRMIIFVAFDDARHNLIN
jgi:hypothetical protein